MSQQGRFGRLGERSQTQPQSPQRPRALPPAARHRQELQAVAIGICEEAEVQVLEVQGHPWKLGGSMVVIRRLQTRVSDFRRRRFCYLERRELLGLIEHDDFGEVIIASNDPVEGFNVGARLV